MIANVTIPTSKEKQAIQAEFEKNVEIMSPATHRRISVTDKNARQQSCVRFKVHYEAVFGESLYVLGSISALGCWRIESALRMNWTEVTQ